MLLLFILCCSLVLRVACNNNIITADGQQTTSQDDEALLQNCLNDPKTIFGTRFDVFCVDNVSSMKRMPDDQFNERRGNFYEINAVGNSEYISTTGKCTDDTLPTREMKICLNVYSPPNDPTVSTCRFYKVKTALTNLEAKQIRIWARSHRSTLKKMIALVYKESMLTAPRPEGTSEDKIAAWFPHAPWLHQSRI